MWRRPYRRFEKPTMLSACCTLAFLRGKKHEKWCHWKGWGWVEGGGWAGGLQDPFLSRGACEKRGRTMGIMPSKCGDCTISATRRTSLLILALQVRHDARSDCAPCHDTPHTSSSST